MVKQKSVIKTTQKASADERFLNVKFAGVFREYQQRVIDNSSKYLTKDEKIHIVAAPGSGKTILGLELICRLGKPALVLSPTIAIREQWKERFAEMFISEKENADEFVSCSLKKPKLITSITYQGLYTSYRKISPKNSGTAKVYDEDENLAMQEDFSGINIVELLQKHNIGTICLDEAHHLRAEWQKALYEFVEQVKQNVTIIALTATPPYDSKKAEWDKYIAMCGPIDEEIFVPELVRSKTLCPHQDYIYYNFPTAEEEKIIEKHQQTVCEAMSKIFEEGKFLAVIKNSGFYQNTKEFEDELTDKALFIKAVLAFCSQLGEKPPKHLLKMLEHGDREIIWNLQTAQTLFQCMISDDVLFNAKDREFVKSFLSSFGLVEKNVVMLITNPKLEKLLISSVGKIKSIGHIVEEEWKNLGENIRLLVLADYIRAGSSVLASDKEIKEMGVIPIFEMLRRKNLGLKLAAISGKIIIVPNEALSEIKKIATQIKTRFKAVAIKNSEYSELKFEGAGSGKKIATITKAFNSGIINCIVGTKSLLGEGWDSPVINTLILASCVGSFMLSNQMRGRAIRIDKNNPNKVGNIWHLTTILPQRLLPKNSANAFPFADYETLERRFNGFMGLNYYCSIIESGLKRADTLNPPYNEQNVEKANQETFKLSANREEVSRQWHLALEKSTNEVVIQNEIPKPKRGFFPAFIIRPSHYLVIKKVAFATIKTFKEICLINKKAKPIIEKNYAEKTVNIGICRCTKYEKSIFHQAISEVFGVIDKPKYILVKTRWGRLDFRASFAVPEIFSNKKEIAEVFCQKMNRRITDLELVFTRSNAGQKHLASAKKRAYVNKTGNEIQAKMKLRPN